MRDVAHEQFHDIERARRPRLPGEWEKHLVELPAKRTEDAPSPERMHADTAGSDERAMSVQHDTRGTGGSPGTTQARERQRSEIE